MPQPIIDPPRRLHRSLNEVEGIISWLKTDSRVNLMSLLEEDESESESVQDLDDLVEEDLERERQ